jgi:hypothetical protein
MPEVKTKPTRESVTAFLNKVPDARRREDATALLALMRRATKSEPVMWGTNIIGFGSYRYKYAGGREGEMPLIGFSPRKQNLTLYVMPGFDGFEDELNDLGPHAIGKSCLYIKRLADIDLSALNKILAKSVAKMRKKTAAA